MHNHKHPQLEKTYNKVIVTIKSCKTKTQLKGASEMVKNFKFLYRKVGYPKILSYNLNKTLNKQYTICQS